jgi:hypothetical protein
MFFASGQARGLPPVEDEMDEELPDPRPAARRPMGSAAGGGRLNAFRAAVGAAAGAAAARPRPAPARPRPVVSAQKKGRGTFTYSRD